MKKWWSQLAIRQKVGGVLAAVGVALTVLLAILGSRDQPPSASIQGLIAFLAIVSQLGGTWAFSGEGRADPTLARRSVARLVGLANRSAAAREQAEALCQKTTSASELREGVCYLSVHLSYIEEGFVEAIEDWRAFHPHAVESAEFDQDRMINGNK